MNTKSMQDVLARAHKEAQENRFGTLTDWFRNGELPHRHGVYERRDCTGYPTHFSKWNGSFWSFARNDFTGANVEDLPSANQNLQWRGLTSNPKVKP